MLFTVKYINLYEGLRMGTDDRKSIVYQEISTERDATTGEMLQNIGKKIVKVAKTPDFIMIFTKQISLLEDLKKMDNMVLFSILTHFVGQRNLVFLSPQTKKRIANELGVDISSITRSINELLKKEVLVTDIEKNVFLNPHIFGKGNWEEIRKLRHELVFEYDFETNVRTIKRNTQAQYISDEELALPHDVIGAEESINITTGRKEQTVYIQESESDVSNINDDIQLLQEQNKQLELQNKQLELQIKLAEIQRN